MTMTRPPTTNACGRRAFVLLLGMLLLAGCTTTLKRCAYEGLGRDGWQHPDRVIEALALRPGDRVADLGSGGGYFTFRLARAVGPTGRVYAVDIDEALNADLRARAAREGFANVEVILARPDDPLLPPASIDLIFTSNTYHHLKDRVAYFASAGKALAPDGRIAVIDFDRRGWMHSLGHYTDPDTIKAEMGAAGYRLEQEHAFLPRQSFLLFSRGG
jgi:arsenite methyltransferase